MALTGGKGVAVILEMLANVNLGRDLEVLAQNGRVVVIGSRGPVEIDPQTRDIDQTVYIRKVEKVNGKLANVEFDKIENVKDPGK